MRRTEKETGIPRKAGSKRRREVDDQDEELCRRINSLHDMFCIEKRDSECALQIAMPNSNDEEMMLDEIIQRLKRMQWQIDMMSLTTTMISFIILNIICFHVLPLYVWFASFI